MFQFCVSIVLIVSTLLLYQQLNFISSKKLGYDPEQVVAIRVMGIQPSSNIEALEKELQQLPTVVSTSLSQSYPGHSILSEDIGKIIGEDDCKCGANGKYFKIYGRLQKSEIRGCSDSGN